MRIPRTTKFETEGILVLRVKKNLGFPGTSSPFMGHQSLAGEFQDSRMQHPFLLGTLALSVVTFF